MRKGYIVVFALLILMVGCSKNSSLELSPEILAKVNENDGKNFVLEGVMYNDSSVLSDFLASGWSASSMDLSKHGDDFTSEILPSNQFVELYFEKSDDGFWATFYNDSNEDVVITEGVLALINVSFVDEDPISFVAYGGVTSRSDKTEIESMLMNSEVSSEAFKNDGVKIIPIYKENKIDVVNVEYIQDGDIYAFERFSSVKEREGLERKFIETADVFELTITGVVEITTSYSGVNLGPRKAFMSKDSSGETFFINDKIGDLSLMDYAKEGDAIT